MGSRSEGKRNERRNTVSVIGTSRLDEPRPASASTDTSQEEIDKQQVHEPTKRAKLPNQVGWPAYTIYVTDLEVCSKTTLRSALRAPFMSVVCRLALRVVALRSPMDGVGCPVLLTG
jgi:hypothetical protein